MAQEEYHSKWKIKKELTAAEAGGCCLYLDMNDVETHIFRYWDRNKIIRVNIDSTPIRVKDVDTNTVHILHFRIYRERRPVFRDGQWVHPPPSLPSPSPLSPPSKEVILGPTDTQCPTLLAVFEGHWRLNFIERRSLGPGDQVGIYYDKTDSYELCFSVLSRRESYKELATQFGKNIPPYTRGGDFDSSTPSEVSINKKRKRDIK